MKEFLDPSTIDYDRVGIANYRTTIFFSSETTVGFVPAIYTGQNGLFNDQT